MGENAFRLQLYIPFSVKISIIRSLNNRKCRTEPGDRKKKHMITPKLDKKLFLIDAYALIFRAYFAFSKNPRMNSKGQNTSAAFGFANALIDVIKNEKPTH